MDLYTMLSGATLVVQFVLGLLVFMSVLSWSVIIFKLMQLNAAKRKAVHDFEYFTKTDNLGEAMLSLCRNPASPVYKVGSEAMSELKRLDAAGMLTVGNADLVMENLKRALDQGLGGCMTKLNAALSILATCANSAPFIGLFGTVWGILHAFQTIGMMKTAALAAVAPGIAEALVATAVGLAVAIPATIAFNFFQGHISAIEIHLGNFSGAFLNTVRRELAGEDAPRRGPTRSGNSGGGINVQSSTPGTPSGGGNYGA
jgi:biopolymer transport protein TolQ